jgi:peptidyl-prolyl cis-trans isomerase SurA
MLRAEVLERLIERALIRQVVERAELEATDADVDQTIATIAAENDLTPERLQQSVEAQGLPFDLYRERIRGEIEHSKVVNGMIGARVRIDESDLRELWDEEYADQPEGGNELHLRHLLVPFDPEDPAGRAEACAEVRAALAKVRGGAAFEDVARELSKANPEAGGDVGWLHETELASWMADALAPLEPGQVTDVIEMPFGCNLLQLVERRPFENVTYEQAKGALRQRVFSKKMAEEYDKFMDELRERTYIERKGIYAEAARLAPTGAPAQGDF